MKKVIKIVLIVILIPLILIGGLRVYGLNQRRLAKNYLKKAIYNLKEGKEVNIKDINNEVITLAKKHSSNIEIKAIDYDFGTWHLEVEFNNSKKLYFDAYKEKGEWQLKLLSP